MHRNYNDGREIKTFKCRPNDKIVAFAIGKEIAYQRVVCLFYFYYIGLNHIAGCLLFCFATNSRVPFINR